MLLCYIDFLRNTKTGDVWKAASNCTGLILAVIVFSGYPLKRFCNAFSYIWTGICLCIVVYAVMWGGYFIFKDIYKWTFVFAVLNVWWLGIYGFYFTRQLFIEKTIKIKPGILGSLWIILTFFMTCNLSGRLWPLWFFLMFGAFYMTEFNENDFIDLAEALLTGTILAFFILQMYCYAFRPYDEIRYKGAYPNSNVASVHYLWVYTFALIKLHILHKKNAHWGWKLFYFLGVAGMLDFMIMTMCRSAWVASVVLALVFGVCIMMRNWRESCWKAVRAGVALLAAVIILFPATFATVRWLPTIHPHPVWHDGEYQEWRIHSWDPADAPQYTEFDEFLGELWERVAGTISISYADPLALKAYAAEAGDSEYEVIDADDIGFLDTSMNVRMAIYRAYLRDMTLWGHPETAGHYQLGNVENGYISWHAQNLWIQVGFSYGIPAGILLIILTVVLLAFYSKRLNKEPENIYGVIPLLVCVMFFTFGLTELNWNVGQYPLFLIFFVQHPQFCRKLRRI